MIISSGITPSAYVLSRYQTGTHVQHTHDNICLSLTPLRFQVRQFGINKHLEQCQ
jgi:hypothetical protein